MLQSHVVPTLLPIVPLFWFLSAAFLAICAFKQVCKKKEVNQLFAQAPNQPFNTPNQPFYTPNEQQTQERCAVAQQRAARSQAKQRHFSESAGILNRNGFVQYTRQLLDQPSKCHFTMVTASIDRFCSLRELFGNTECLRLVAALGTALRTQLLNKQATFGHLGGDCFACCIPNSLANPKQILQIIDASLALHFKDHELIAKIGLYELDDLTLSVNDMLDRTLMALHFLGSDPLKRYAYYDCALKQRKELEQRIVTDTPAALRNHQFKVYYQPQYSLQTNRISGMEALARWEHPEFGFIPPALFIPLLEQSGLISRLSEFVRNETLSQIVRWKNELHLDLSVSVNISRLDTFEEGFVEKLEQELHRFELSHGALRLEITETAYIQNETHMVRVVNSLRQAGFSVEMDDFGSGYSSLNTLKDLPVDTLKLDMRFLLGTSNERGKIILLAVVEMAKSLGLRVIAEGVETREQFELLKSIGCECMQGYYRSRPLPTKEITALLQAQLLCK
ncbi:MAG: GGDEF domain-containing phosphodiesterase [Clostridia bacterium]